MGHTRANWRKRREAELKAALEQAKDEGIAEAFEVFIPKVLVMIEERQALMPKIMDLVDRAVDEGDTQAIKDLTPIMNTMVNEDKRLMDRFAGGVTQRQQVEVSGSQEVRVTHEISHVTLDALLSGNRERLNQLGAPPNQEVIDAELVERD